MTRRTWLLAALGAPLTPVATKLVVVDLSEQTITTTYRTRPEREEETDA